MCPEALDKRFLFHPASYSLGMVHDAEPVIWAKGEGIYDQHGKQWSKGLIALRRPATPWPPVRR